jgi:hypothetical protein
MDKLEEGKNDTTIVETNDFSAAFGEATNDVKKPDEKQDLGTGEEQSTGDEKQTVSKEEPPETTTTVTDGEKPKTAEELAAMLEQERTAFRTELEAVKKQIETLTGTPPKKEEPPETKPADKKTIPETIDFNDLSDVTEEIKAELSEYEENFDEISKFEGIKRTKALTKLKDYVDAMIGRVIEIVQPLAETVAENKKASHFDKVAEVHSDYQTIYKSGDMLKWIEEQPTYLQAGFKKVYTSGKTDEVIDLYSRYKKDRGIATTTTTKPDEKKPLHVVVKNKSTPIKLADTEKGAGDPNDFEGGFSEAISKLK